MIYMAKTNKDSHGRYRSLTVSFRVSHEENEAINQMVKISGMTKQGYIRTRLECKDVVVVGNPRVYKGLKTLLLEIERLLVDIAEKHNAPDDELLELIKIIANVLGEMKEAEIVKERK